MKKQAMILSLPILVALMISACGDDEGGPTTSSSPSTPPPAPPPVIERFTLSAPDGFFEFSSPLATPSVGESIDIRFTPLAIRRGNSGFANVVAFWVDRGPADNGIAMGLEWFQGDMWGVYTFTPADGFVEQPGLFRIEVGGDFGPGRVAIPSPAPARANPTSLQRQSSSRTKTAWGKKNHFSCVFT